MKKLATILAPVSSMLVAVSAMAMVMAASTDAHAVAIYNTGDDIFEVGPLPESLKGEGVDEYKAGFKCEVFGLFWAYITWWGCEPVIFSGDTYLDGEVVEEAVLAEYSESDMKLGFWPGYGRWLMLLALIGVIAAGIFMKDAEDDDDFFGTDDDDDADDDDADDDDADDDDADDDADDDDKAPKTA